MTAGTAPSVAHRIRRMTGRDHHEDGRTASDLELFFDLTFVVAFSVAGVQVAEYLAEGHYRTAIAGFLFSSFATICSLTVGAWSRVLEARSTAAVPASSSWG